MLNSGGVTYSFFSSGRLLRRQQAEAVVMARQKLVDGAVGMVEVALKNLEEKQIVSLTSDQRAVLATNS